MKYFKDLIEHTTSAICNSNIICIVAYYLAQILQNNGLYTLNLLLYLLFYVNIG